jgi:LmbE family N-acetylglucosaminyl deacetylase
MTSEAMRGPALFPSDWSTAVVIVPHPDDPEYLSAAVAAARHSGA